MEKMKIIEFFNFLFNFRRHLFALTDCRLNNNKKCLNKKTSIKWKSVLLF